MLSRYCQINSQNESERLESLIQATSRLSIHTKFVNTRSVNVSAHLLSRITLTCLLQFLHEGLDRLLRPLLLTVFLIWSLLVREQPLDNRRLAQWREREAHSHSKGTARELAVRSCPRRHKRRSLSVSGDGFCYCTSYRSDSVG